MNRPVAAYLLDPVAFDQIYGTVERAQITELADVAHEPMSAAEFAASTRDFSAVEIVLSGWGAPVMDGLFLDRLPALRAVLYGAGTIRRFATPELARRGVQVTTAALGNSVPVADYTVAAVHLSLKRLWPVLRGAADNLDVAAVLGGYKSTLGLVALGAVGRLVCDRFRGSDLELLAYDPFVTGAEARMLGVRLVGLDELFARSDVVSIHAPLLESTRGLVTGQLVSSMPRYATLINTARGAVLDQAAVEVALRDRPDIQAVLDVTDPEPLPADSALRSMPNVVLTPHVAGSIGRECNRLGQMMVDELRRYVAGEPFSWPARLDALEQIPMP